MRNYSLIIGGEVSRYVKGGSRTRHPRPRGVSPGLHFGPVGVAGGQLKTCVRACVRTCVRAFVRAYVRACVRTCVRARGRGHGAGGARRE